MPLSAGHSHCGGRAVFQELLHSEAVVGQSARMSHLLRRYLRLQDR